MKIPTNVKKGIFVLFIVLISVPAWAQIESGPSNSTMESTVQEACPVDVAKARDRLEKFIFSSPGSEHEPLWKRGEWAEKAGIAADLAQVTGRRQIQLLDDPQDTGACRRLNELHRDDLTARRDILDWVDENPPDPTYRYDVVYYKVAAYYFVVRVSAPLPQPDNPALRASTTMRDLFVIYDQDLNQITSYLW